MSVICRLSSGADQSVLVPAPGVIEGRQLTNALYKLADSAEPRVVNLQPGDDVAALIKREYRDAAPAMWDLVKKANEGALVHAELAESASLPQTLPVKTPEKQFILPFGPYWIRSNTIVTVQKGETLQALIARHMGATTPEESSRAFELLQRANPARTLSQLREGEALIIPRRSIARVAVPAGNAAAFATTLGRNSTHAAPEIQPIEPLSSSDVECKDSAQRWPMDWAALASQHHENLRELARRSQKPDLVYVAILDSGVHEAELERNRIGFWVGGRNSSIGEDVSEGYDPESDAHPWIDSDSSSTKMKNHGTHVAALVQGGAIDAEYRAALKEWSRLMMMKVVSFPRLKNDSEFVITAAAVHRAIKRAVDYKSTVLNLSIESRGLGLSWDSLTTEFGRQLFIVAAGNGRLEDGRRIGINFSGNAGAPAPAGLGGAASGNVISVAAHDGEGKAAQFSNYGKDHITLAAPGCGIRSYLPGDPPEGPYSGTSQAAPLVTLIATLLSEYKVPLSDIKPRLIASVDVKPDLRNYVFASGMLNAEKALHVFEDIVELQQGESRKLVACRVATAEKPNGYPVVSFREGSEERGYLPEREVIRLERVRKITPLKPYAGAGTQVRIVYEPDRLGEGSKLALRIQEGELLTPLACFDRQDQAVSLEGLQDVVTALLPGRQEGP